MSTSLVALASAVCVADLASASLPARSAIAVAESVATPAREMNARRARTKDGTKISDIDYLPHNRPVQARRRDRHDDITCWCPMMLRPRHASHWSSDEACAERFPERSASAPAQGR